MVIEILTTPKLNQKVPLTSFAMTAFLLDSRFTKRAIKKLFRRLLDRDNSTVRKSILLEILTFVGNGQFISGIGLACPYCCNNQCNKTQGVKNDESDLEIDVLKLVDDVNIEDQGLR